MGLIECLNIWSLSRTNCGVCYGPALRLIRDTRLRHERDGGPWDYTDSFWFSTNLRRGFRAVAPPKRLTGDLQGIFASQSYSIPEEVKQEWHRHEDTAEYR